MKRKLILSSIFLIMFIGTGLVLPQDFSMPVDGATSSSYNPNSYWYYPWGKSITHKGVDIFAKEGTTIYSSTPGIVVYCGHIAMGGNVVLVLGPKWRLHYYAHLQTITARNFEWADKNKRIGTVGTTGNAVGKSPHLHYSIITLIPYMWRADKSIQGWKKMFYLNPIDFLK